MDWKSLTPDERRMLHMVYDHAPSTPWETVFFRFQAAYCVEKKDRIVHMEGLGAILYARYNVPAAERQAKCEKLRANLVKYGFIFEEGRAEHRGSVNYNGKGARLTDQGFFCLGSPAGGELKIDFESSSPPNRGARDAKDRDSAECLACGKPMSENLTKKFGTPVCSDACNAQWKAKIRAQIEGYSLDE